MTLNGILLFFVIGIGLIGLYTSIALIVSGVIKKQKSRISLGFYIGIAPVLASLYFFQLTMRTIPEENKDRMVFLAGNYSAEYFHEIASDSLNIESCSLELFKDGKFETDNADNIALPKEGQWECCGVDDMIKLYNPQGDLIAWISVSGNGLSYEFKGNSIEFR